VVANRRDRLGKIYEAMGYMSEAEEQYKLALGIRQAGSGQIDSDLGASTNHLGMMLLGQGRGKEALPLIQRSVEIAQAVVVRNDEIQREHGVDFSEAFKQLGTIDTNKGNLADAWNNLGLVLGAEQDYAEAEKAFQKSLKIDEELYGTEHPEIAIIRNNLGLIYQRQRQFEKAENEFRTAAQINIKAFGENHPANMLSFQNLGMLDLVRGNYKQAETLLLGAVAGRVKFLGERNPNTAISYSALGGLYFTLSRWAEAYQALGRANDITIKNALREARTPQAGSEVITKSELSGARSGFLLQVVAGHMLAESTPERRAEIDDSNFKIAQWTINSEAGLAVSKMSARFGPDDPTLAGLLRERQDMAARYRLLDGQATEAASQPAGQRDAATIQALHAELAAADKRIHAIDEQLKTNFAKYAAIATPEPLSIKDVQDLLGKRETLLLLLDSPQMGPVSQGTYIWAISKTAARAVKSPIGGAALADRVAALRCGLDASHWIDPSNWPTDDAFRSQRKTDQQQRRDRCRMLLNANYDPAKPVGPVPYDLALAYDLYQVFFSQIADLITGKDLLIIPSGPLQSLPFQVLLTSKPETARPPSSAAYRRANWLVQTNAITNLPSVSSLKALRSLGKSSTAAPKAYFGIGNPKLDGHPGCAKLTAPSFVTCPGEFETASLNQSEGNALLSRAASPAPSMQSVMRNGHTDVGAIRAQCPLPETGFEMRCVAKSLGSGADVVLEGLRASEAILKAEPLDHFGVLHFATHGALAGEAKGLLRGDDEPGLLLTPPKTASEADDGFLSASEVTSLKLNADVVVLSACNTAGGATDDAEALSGLARAFFYAGARALLVSHWQVNSEAAVKLVSRMFAELRAHGNIGRAEALRRSSRVLIESDPASYAAHPAYWAPFVVVGEGGTRAAP
jgi:CHAT domain-containing protein/Tfp pilus assembly protein PilF